MNAGKTCLTLVGAVALSIGSPASAVTYVGEVVASGLYNPRGLAFGPDGSLYIAESGYYVPGSPTTVNGRGVAYSYSTTGSITQLSSGVQTRILTGLPSIGSVADVSGPNDIAFSADGAGYVVIGLGLNPTVRTSDLAGTGAWQLGQLYTFTPGGITSVADISAYEAGHNPAGGPLDSNPFHIASSASGMLVTDAGGNDLLRVSPDAAVGLVDAFPPAAAGAPERVPTGIAVAADGSYWLSELTGAPFIPGTARIFHILPDGSIADVFSGFTMLTDLAFGVDGALYGLEYDTNGLFAPGGPGALLRINGDGSSETLFTDLTNPTGLTIGSDGAFYATNFSASAGGGQVVRIAAVPEASTWALMLVGFGMVGVGLRRSRRCLLTPASIGIENS
ncbi:hypothetical protein GCM10022276_06220 [Sphingomonas limnosediminicola]|uniref:Ice-binding protein C-terminal domain-containing protein n=1 Tax=Sphingomonas limnosediminicola TaxID=940133 RepID=A0ABP7KZQ4_9SPHN